MTDTVNRSLDEIPEVGTRSKLEGFQETVSDLDVDILATRRDIEQKKGTLAALGAVLPRVMGFTQEIQKGLDAQTLSPDEARIRMDQTTRIISVLRNFENEVRGATLQAQGKLIGLEQIVAKLSKRFDDTVLKYERHKRMEEEDASTKKSGPTTPVPSGVTRVFKTKVRVGKKRKK